MNNQQPKPDPKGKAIASLVLGIISALWPPIQFLSVMIIMMAQTGGGYFVIIFLHSISFFVASLISIIGITLGVQGLKSTRKGLAIAGIVLCVIGLGGLLYNYYFFNPAPLPTQLPPPLSY